MIKNSILSGAAEKIAPLFSFHSVVDIDVGLINLVKNEYMNKTVFNEKLLDIDPFRLLNIIYFRKEPNPLYLIANSGVLKSKLDEYYYDFIDEKYDRILEYSVSTEILTFIRQLDENTDLLPFIFYSNDEELKVLEEFNFNNVSFIKSSNLSSYNTEINKEIFVKYTDELEPFCNSNFGGRVFYVASNGINMNDTRSQLKDESLLLKFNGYGSTIYTYDMYNLKVIGGPK